MNQLVIPDGINSLVEVQETTIRANFGDDVTLPCIVRVPDSNLTVWHDDVAYDVCYSTDVFTLFRNQRPCNVPTSN